MRLSGALLVFLLVTGSAFAEDPMKFVYFEDFAPYSYREDGCMKGILIDVTDRIVRTQMGLLVRHTGYPWERAQAMVRTGEADAFISVPTPARSVYEHRQGSGVNGNRDAVQQPGKQPRSGNRNRQNRLRFTAVHDGQLHRQRLDPKKSWEAAGGLGSDAGSSLVSDISKPIRRLHRRRDIDRLSYQEAGI
ncbi:hypothetical protein [Desulfosarcina cetonica]|uniref:hypothetical protein n=1 Tax=Desulfosarcina cetonica TaxID=90730 RepID=UPI001FEE0F8E|nr:hypothetical protein [Desulfosarcina cetonica]